MAASTQVRTHKINEFSAGRLLSTFSFCSPWKGFKINHLDLTPRFAGILMSFTNCFANFFGLLAPIVAGEWPRPEIDPKITFALSFVRREHHRRKGRSIIISITFINHFVSKLSQSAANDRTVANSFYDCCSNLHRLCHILRCLWVGRATEVGQPGYGRPNLAHTEGGWQWKRPEEAEHHRDKVLAQDSTFVTKILFILRCLSSF